MEGVLCRTPNGAAVMIQETDNADTAANTAIGFDTDGKILCLSQTNPVGDLPRRERDGLQSANCCLSGGLPIRRGGWRHPSAQI